MIRGRLALFLTAIILAKVGSFRILHSVRRNLNNVFSFQLSMNSDAYNQLLSNNPIVLVAQNAARQAGKLIIDGSGTIDLTNGVESKIGSRDIVTVVDKNAQDTIKEVIFNAFPNHNFLGEEDIPAGIEASKAAINKFKDVENLWIVDPIDGTTNFAHGMPLSGVIIAFSSYGKVLYGIIYDPFHDEMFIAGKNMGAYLNGIKIQCCKTKQLCDSVVATGSPPNILALEACLRATTLISPEVRTVRMLGSAAIMLSWVAIGRLTAYFEADLNAWDLAAGSLIIKEAGGEVTDSWGNEFQLSTRNLVASNGHIHSALLEYMIKSKMWIIETV